MPKLKFRAAPKFAAYSAPKARAAKTRRSRGSVSPATRKHDANFFGRGAYGS